MKKPKLSDYVEKDFLRGEKLKNLQKRCPVLAAKPCKVCGEWIPVFLSRDSLAYNEWLTVGATAIVLDCPKCKELTTPTLLSENEKDIVWLIKHRKK